MYPNPGMFPGFRPQSMGYTPQMQQMPAPQMMTVTPVTGMAQVEAAQVSFDGTPMFFYDTASDALYVKQFNAQNGTSPIVTYRREVTPPAPQWATVDMLNELAERVNAIMATKPARKKEAEAE
jgi:hypothetical protein